MKTQLVFLSLWILLAGSVHGQVPGVAAGDRVRVTGDLRGTFTVAEVTQDTLVMGQGPRVAHSALRTLSVHRGRRSTASGMGRGALIGLGVGAAAGTVVGLLLKADEDYSYGQYHSGVEVAAVWAGVLGFGGLVSGALVGAAAPGERWERVLPARAPRRRDGGLQVGWSMPL